MTRITKSRLTGIAVVLLLPLVLGSCSTCEECIQAMEDSAELFCPPGSDPNCPIGYAIFWTLLCLPVCVGYSPTSDCNPPEIAQSCIDNPEECQEYFDAWVESLDTVPEE